MRPARIVLVILAACQSGSDKPAAGSGTSAPGSAAGSAAASATADAAPSGDACTPVKMCAAFTAAHVDQLCHTKTATTSALDAAPRDNAMIDSCQYMDDKHDNLVLISRTCIPGSGGGTSIAKQLFDVDRSQKAASDLQIDLQAIGDQAYYRVSETKTQVMIAVRKGNIVTRIQSVATPATESVVQKECLLVLFRELATK